MSNTKSLIRDWVIDNFGESEAEDPSWNIDLLARWLDDNRKEDLFAIRRVLSGAYNDLYDFAAERDDYSDIMAKISNAIDMVYNLEKGAKK